MKLEKLVHRPQLAFVAITTLFGLLSMVLMPVLAAPDENQHFQVAYAMFSSNRHAPKDLVLNEDMILSAIRGSDYKNFYTQKTSAQYDGVGINPGSNVFDGKTRASVFDIMHLPQAIGVLIGRLIYPSIGVMVLMGRLFTLATYIAVLYLVIKKVKYGKWVFVFVACLPIMIQQAASLSYDPINFLAIAAWTAFVINLATEQAALTRTQIITGSLLALFLLLSKSNNLVLLALLVAMPRQRLTSTKLFIKTRSKKYWPIMKYGLWIVFGLAMCAALYVMSIKLLAGHEFHPHKLISVLLNTFFWGDLGLIDVTTIGMVGQFSNFYYHLPVWIVIITFAVLSIIMLAEKLPHISRRFAITSGLLFVGSILLISIGMYYAWALRPVRLGANAQVTDGIQGRYFTPLLLLLFPAIAYIQSRVRIEAKNKNAIPILGGVTSVLLLTLYVVQTWHFFWK